jgi:hypothetical protein
MMTDSELRREIKGGSQDAVGELAARRENRKCIRGIDPQARLRAHHCGPARPPSAGGVTGRPLMPPRGRRVPPTPAGRAGC